MSVQHSHDIGLDLQHKIEALEEVERCFVHIDYQQREGDDHDPSIPVAYKVRWPITPAQIGRGRGVAHGMR